MYHAVKEVLEISWYLIKLTILRKLNLIVLPEKLPDHVICEVTYVGYSSFQATIIEPKGFENHQVRVIPQLPIFSQAKGICTTHFITDAPTEELKKLGYDDSPTYYMKRAENNLNLYQYSLFMLFITQDELHEMTSSIQNLDKFHTAFHGVDTNLPSKVQVEFKLRTNSLDRPDSRYQDILEHRVIPYYNGTPPDDVLAIN